MKQEYYKVLRALAKSSFEDCYHGLNTKAFTSNLRAMSALSQEKLKPCGVTETGQESFENADYWTSCILSPLMGQRVSMVVMWRNKYVGEDEDDKHFYSVYPGHVSADDFNIMYNRSRSLFSTAPVYRSISYWYSVEPARNSTS